MIFGPNTLPLPLSIIDYAGVHSFRTPNTHRTHNAHMYRTQRHTETHRTALNHGREVLTSIHLSLVDVTYGFGCRLHFLKLSCEFHGI